MFGYNSENKKSVTLGELRNIRRKKTQLKNDIAQAEMKQAIEKQQKKAQEAKKASEESFVNTDFSMEGDYGSWIKELKSSGLKTTSLGKNETNFKEYADALSDNLKNELLKSFDTKEDYELQQKLSGLFKGKNVHNTNSFISQCKSMGLKVSSTYTKTSYKVDAKATGGGQAHLKSNGAINVLTISDPKTGAEIKIADSNGNGAIEVEELFLNQLLGDVSSSIDKMDPVAQTQETEEETNTFDEIKKMTLELNDLEMQENNLEREMKSLERKEKEVVEVENQEVEEVEEKNETSITKITQNDFNKMKEIMIEDILSKNFEMSKSEADKLAENKIGEFYQVSALATESIDVLESMKVFKK